MRGTRSMWRRTRSLPIRSRVRSRPWSRSDRRRSPHCGRCSTTRSIPRRRFPWGPPARTGCAPATPSEGGNWCRSGPTGFACALRREDCGSSTSAGGRVGRRVAPARGDGAVGGSMAGWNWGRPRSTGRWAACGLVLLGALMPAGGMSPPAAAQDRSPVLVTLEADSAEVTDLLEILAQRAGLNIVSAPEVQGQLVSLRVSETPFEEALNLVVRAAGLGYERMGNSILVGDPRNLATETGLETRVFELHYADAGEVREMLDVVTRGVTANLDGTRLVVRAAPADMEAAADVIAQLDRPPEQVLIEARLIEVNRSALAEIGIDWERLTSWGTVVTEGAVAASPPDGLPEEIGYTLLGEGGRFYRQMEAFEVALDALLTDGHANLLSHAKVLTLNGKPAEIFAGETVPVVVTSLQSATASGALQTVELEEIDVGVQLHITPRVGEDGFITALVEPEVSRILAFVGPDDDLPQTSTRRARSLVRMQDGQTVYLGGLLSEERRRTVKKVPILGSIPLLGHFFRHYRDETQRVDLVIEIIPRLIRDGVADASAGSAGGQ
ncbi:MAG: hypothetical protein GF330_12960 [Candidatus Eisenbacteria bacterium]|nr:hypothetical protein [Candidatus Eisenbacteria bacterium]